MSTYRVLQEDMRPFADAAVKYFKKEFGVPSMRIEEELSAKVEFRPTLQGLLPDKHILCGEVCETLFPPFIEKFVLACRNHGLPVKLFVVIPKGQVQQIETKALTFAQENGIAILEVDENGSGKVLQGMPLSLSLGGLRSFDVGEFPPKYRGAVGAAIQTFKQGNPDKGCSLVYDEIEALTRKAIRKCNKIPKGLTKAPTFDLDKESWANVLEFLKKHVDKAQIKCPELTPALFNRLIALPPHRNDTGHKPASLEKLIQRDRQLRTRFEAAVDDLLAFIKAVQPLRL
jgi:hypothetical protein